MVAVSDLKEILILAQLKDEMLTKLKSVVKQVEYQENELVFDEGGKAESFFMIKQGKVLLEKRISNHVTISLGAVKQGYSFGWSAILGRLPFSMSAKCAEKSTILTMKSDAVFPILDTDPAMGYIFMQHLGAVMKNRIDRMEEQLLRSFKEHPDFKPLLEN
jgi:CRP/FNR family transcriptional regulator, cyclic AMP receptor protein